MEEAARIVRTPGLFNHEQVTEAREFLKNPAGGGGQVQEPVQAETEQTQKKEGNRGFLGWRSSADWLTGGLTDFDEKGSEGNLFNPVSGGTDGKWGPEAVGPIEELPPTVIELPAVNMSGITGSGGGDPSGPVNATPNISSNDSNNIYSMAAQTNFNVVSV